MRKSDFHDYVMQDLMRDIRGVTSRAMFGGWGLYRDGMTFGIIADDQLFFKVDDHSRGHFEKKGSGPFVYESRGKKVTLKSYWEVPADVAEEPETLECWVQAACRAAQAKAKQAPGWSVYMLRCADKSLYTGIAKDVRRRLAEHRAGRGSKFVRSRLPVRLVYQKKFKDRSSALKEEARIKALTPQRKKALVE